MCGTKEFGHCCFSHGSNGESELIHTLSMLRLMYSIWSDNKPHAKQCYNHATIPFSPALQKKRDGTAALQLQYRSVHSTTSDPGSRSTCPHGGWKLWVTKLGSCQTWRHAKLSSPDRSLPQPGCRVFRVMFRKHPLRLLTMETDWCEKCVMHHIWSCPCNAQKKADV